MTGKQYLQKSHGKVEGDAVHGREVDQDAAISGSKGSSVLAYLPGSGEVEAEDRYRRMFLHAKPKGRKAGSSVMKELSARFYANSEKAAQGRRGGRCLSTPN